MSVGDVDDQTSWTGGESDSPPDTWQSPGPNANGHFSGGYYDMSVTPAALADNPQVMTFTGEEEFLGGTITINWDFNEGSNEADDAGYLVYSVDGGSAWHTIGSVDDANTSGSLVIDLTGATGLMIGVTQTEP